MKPIMSVHDRTASACCPAAAAPPARRQQYVGRPQAEPRLQRMRAPADPLALEPGPRRRRRVGQPRRHERPAAPAKARAHRGGVDEGADRRGRQGDDHCYRLGDDGTGAARATKGQARGGVLGVLASTTATRRRRGHRSPVFVRLRRLLPRRAGAHVRHLPGRRHARDVGARFVEKVQKLDAPASAASWATAAL